MSITSRVVAALNVLAARPGLLCLLALALNALVQPYVGLIHDARLYALQVTNRVQDGAFSHDLFLRYGSQDSYSLFSLLTAPLVAHLGVPCTFFLFYLLARSLFFFALACFVLKLFGQNARAALAVLILAVDPVPFGGFGVFNVNEAFLTPRLPAVALTLLGLTALLQLRWLPAAACFFVGCLLHPLIAIVGFPLLLGWAVLTRWPERGLAALTLLVCAGCLLVLGIPPLAYRIFGLVDATWLEQVRFIVGYQFPSGWHEKDWWRVIGTVGLVATTAGLCVRDNRTLANFLGLALLVGLGGLLTATVASEAGYRLLFQAQLYRAMWVAQVLAVPSLLLLLARASETGRDLWRVLAVAAAWVFVTDSGRDECLALAILLPPLLVWFRGLARVPRRTDWFATSFTAACVIGPLLTGLWRFGSGLALIGRIGQVDALEYVAWLYSLLGLAGLIAVVVTGLVVLESSLRTGPSRVAVAALTVALLVPSGLFALTQTAWYRDHAMPDSANVQFVAEVLAERPANRRVPTVYWPGVRVEQVWLEVRACAYYDFLQMVGLIFNRENAFEGARRARVVGSFEVERFCRGRSSLPEAERIVLERLHGVSPTEARVDAALLARVAREPDLDYIVLDRDLGVPYLATNGAVFVYDCAGIRDLDARAGR